MNAYTQIKSALDDDQFSKDQFQLFADIKEAAEFFQYRIDAKINKISQMRLKIRHAAGLKIENHLGWYNNWRNVLSFTDLKFEGTDGDYLLISGEYDNGQCGTDYHDQREYKNFFPIAWLNMTDEQLTEIFTKDAERDKEQLNLQEQAKAQAAQQEQEQKDRELLKELQKKYGAEND